MALTFAHIQMLLMELLGNMYCKVHLEIFHSVVWALSMLLYNIPTRHVFKPKTMFYSLLLLLSLLLFRSRCYKCQGI